MIWRLSESLPASPVQWQRGVIWLRDDRLLADPGAAELPELLARICSLNDVWLVEIDHRERRATIRIPVERGASEVLSELAVAIKSTPGAAQVDCIQALLRRVPAERQHTSLLRCERHVNGWQLGPPVTSGLARAALLALAAGGFGMSVVGAIVPGIPTVPFVLLTSYFLVRSSPPLNDRLLRSRLFGPLLHDWQRYGGMRPGVKWIATISTLLVLFTSVLAFEVSGLLVLVVLVLAAVGIYWIWRLPQVPGNESAAPVMPAALAASST